jgi:zinc D-Ala-D-Ala carboxypeptidase
MNLSKHFTLEEFTKSQTGERLGIDNMPTEAHLVNMKRLCEDVLEVVRENLGPVHINSGYRGTALNTIVGGKSNSQHCNGEAADIEIPGVTNGALAEWIAANCDYDQLILECYKTGVPTSGWVHVSYKAEGNRKQLLTAAVVEGKMTYVRGICP